MEGTDSDGDVSSHEDDPPSPSSCSLGSTKTEDKPSPLYDRLITNKHDVLESGDGLCITPNAPNTGLKGIKDITASNRNGFISFISVV